MEKKLTTSLSTIIVAMGEKNCPNQAEYVNDMLNTPAGFRLVRGKSLLLWVYTCEQCINHWSTPISVFTCTIHTKNLLWDCIYATDNLSLYVCFTHKLKHWPVQQRLCEAMPCHESPCCVGALWRCTPFGETAWSTNQYGLKHCKELSSDSSSLRTEGKCVQLLCWTADFPPFKS